MAEGSLTGIPASPGYFIGKGYVVPKSEISTFQPPYEPYVLVTRTTDPDYFALMYQAGAIVTEIGGAAAHAAIVARELGKPSVVTVPNATQILGGKMVTVNGTSGEVSYKEYQEPKTPSETIINENKCPSIMTWRKIKEYYGDRGG